MPLNSFFTRFHDFFSSRPPLFVFLFLALIGLIAYANAVNHPFVHDDIVFIEHNPYIKSINLSEIFLYTSSSSGQKSIVNTYWRPMLELVYRLEYKLFKLNPAGFHFINILMHIINAFLVYKFILTLRQNRKLLALSVAVAFLIHPVQTEAVACVSGISNLLFAFFTLSSFLCYVHATQYNRLSAFIFSLILFIFSLLTKEQAVILPFLIVLYELCFFPNRRVLLNTKIYCYATILLFYLLFRTYYIGSIMTFTLENRLELWYRILAIPQTYLMYLKILIWPNDLHYYRSTDILEPFFIPMGLLIVLLAVFVTVVIKATSLKRKILIFSLFWFLICLGPVSNILPLINEYSFILTSEHFLYLPMIGVVMFVFTSMEGWIERNKNLSILFYILICILFLFVTMKQNTYWRGEIPLFQRTLKYQPNFGRVRSLLGSAYYFEGNYAKAIKEYEKAYKIMEAYAQKSTHHKSKKFYMGYLKRISFNMAHSYEALGQIEVAIEWYQKALAIDPFDAVLFNNMGISYVKLKKHTEAKKYFERALALDPENSMAKNNLAIIHIFLDEKEKALKLYEEILKKDPHNRSTQMNYNNLLLELKGK